MPESIIERVNRLSAHLATYRPTKRELQVGRSRAYYERLNEGRLPLREGRARMNRGQVPLVIKQGRLLEVEEFGGRDA